MRKNGSTLCKFRTSDIENSLYLKDTFSIFGYFHSTAGFRFPVDRYIYIYIFDSSSAINNTYVVHLNYNGYRGLCIK